MFSQFASCGHSCAILCCLVNVALLPPLENFQIRQTMCDTLIVMFSNMATNGNDQAIVNPPASLDPLCGNTMVFQLRTVQQTSLKLSAKFAQQLQSIVPVDIRSEVLDSKMVKTSPGTKPVLKRDS